MRRDALVIRSSWRRAWILLALAVLVLAGARAATWASPQVDERSPAASHGRAAGAGTHQRAGAHRQAGAAADPVVAAAGDIAPDEAGGHHQSTSDRILAIDPDAVLALGDEQYPDGALEDFQRYYATTWGRFKDRTKPTPGNHEYETGDAAGYFDYFGAAAKPNGASYYSYDLGEWHLVSLDSNVDRDAGSPQERWLRDDLAANTRPCVLAYWHHPRFSSGIEHGNDESVGPFWSDLHEAKADVVVNGHEHQYERFAPQNPDAAADPQGIREFVVGTGGKSLYPFGAADPNSEVRDNSNYGVLALTLHPDGYDWRFVSENGAVVDSGGPVPCH